MANLVENATAYAGGVTRVIVDRHPADGWRRPPTGASGCSSRTRARGSPASVPTSSSASTGEPGRPAGPRAKAPGSGSPWWPNTSGCTAARCGSRTPPGGGPASWSSSPRFRRRVPDGAPCVSRRAGRASLAGRRRPGPAGRSSPRRRAASRPAGPTAIAKSDVPFHLLNPATATTTRPTSADRRRARVDLPGRPDQHVVAVARDVPVPATLERDARRPARRPHRGRVGAGLPDLPVGTKARSRPRSPAASPPSTSPPIRSRWWARPDPGHRPDGLHRHRAARRHRRDLPDRRPGPRGADGRGATFRAGQPPPTCPRPPTALDRAGPVGHPASRLRPLRPGGHRSTGARGRRSPGPRPGRRGPESPRSPSAPSAHHRALRSGPVAVPRLFTWRSTSSTIVLTWRVFRRW